MRYLVTARVKSGQEVPLLRAIEEKSLGRGSVAEGEYLANMHQARVCSDGCVKWVEVCFCDVPLDEERPYWEEFFEIVSIKDAHARSRCKDLNGKRPWACGDCSCTKQLDRHLAKSGDSFLAMLRTAADSTSSS